MIVTTLAEGLPLAGIVMTCVEPAGTVIVPPVGWGVVTPDGPPIIVFTAAGPPLAGAALAGMVMVVAPFGWTVIVPPVG